MGTFDTGLYDSDTALDLKDAFADWSRIPGTTDDLIRAVLAGHDGATDKTDEDYCDIWLVLADLLHMHGLDHKETFKRARHAITSGLDLETKRELEMEPRDLEKRAAVLAGLLERWAKPHPKPKQRKLLKAPEPQAFPAGTIVAYPTCGGQALNYADVKNVLGLLQDGWGCGIILATGHERGWFGWTAAARLSVHGKQKPTLAEAMKASIENQPCYKKESGKGTLAFQVGSLPPLHAKRMRFEVLGRVDLGPAQVAELHPAMAEPKHVPAATIHHVWTWWADGVEPKYERRAPGLANPKPAIALRKLLA